MPDFDDILFVTVMMLGTEKYVQMAIAVIGLIFVLCGHFIIGGVIWGVVILARYLMRGF
jgi:hypothetical protein